MSTGTHDDLLAPADRGCLTIADVTGYTDYLEQVELEHAQDVLADLTQTMVDHLTPTLRLSKIEGDAAFAYALETEIEASMLLDTVEETYFAFRSRVRDIDQATSCDCNACQLIPELNLKFVVHHGQFARQQVAGGEELTGPDVILVHRLLKNTVRDEFDLRGYAFFTQPCIEALEIDPGALSMREHHERYDGQEVRGYVEDLQTRWRFEDERRRVYVTPDAAEFEHAMILPAPPKIVWEFVTAPERRLQWQVGVKNIDEDTRGGRRGAGTVNHCVHGRNVSVQKVLDWRPFRYFTIRSQYPGIGWWTWTWELQPLDGERTELRVRPERLEGFKRRAFWTLMKPLMTRQGGQNEERLRAVLAEHMGQLEDADVTAAS